MLLTAPFRSARRRAEGEPSGPSNIAFGTHNGAFTDTGTIVGVNHPQDSLKLVVAGNAVSSDIVIASGWNTILPNTENGSRRLAIAWQKAPSANSGWGTDWAINGRYSVLYFTGQHLTDPIDEFASLPMEGSTTNVHIPALAPFDPRSEVMWGFFRASAIDQISGIPGGDASIYTSTSAGRANLWRRPWDTADGEFGQFTITFSGTGDGANLKIGFALAIRSSA